MAIECYYGQCRFHGSRETPPDEGPFCHQSNCRASEHELKEFASARQREKDLALIKEAVRYGQFANDFVRQHGLAEPIRQAIFRLVDEA